MRDSRSLWAWGVGRGGVVVVVVGGGGGGGGGVRVVQGLAESETRHSPLPSPSVFGGLQTQNGCAVSIPFQQFLLLLVVT